MFLGNRSVYLIVFNLVDPASEARVDFWVQSIKARASQVNIIVAATHAEDPRAGTPEEVKRKLTAVKNKCKQILRSFHSLTVLAISPTSSSGYLGIDQLRDNIEAVICRQRHLQQKIPTSYFLFENMLIEQRQRLSVPIMSFSDMKVLAVLSQLETNTEIPRIQAADAGRGAAPPIETPKGDAGSKDNSETSAAQVIAIEDQDGGANTTTDSGSATSAPSGLRATAKKPQPESKAHANKALITALQLLHDLGSILFFGDDAHLNDKIVLDPQWLANLMASLFTTKHTWVRY